MASTATITPSLPQGSLRSAFAKLDEDTFRSLAHDSQPGSPALGATKIASQPSETHSPLAAPTSQPTSTPASKPRSPVLTLLTNQMLSAAEIEPLTTSDATLLCPHWNLPESHCTNRRHSSIAHTGPEAIAKTFAEMREHRKGLKFDVETSFGSGEDVAVFGRVQWQSEHLGRRVSMPFAVWAKVDLEGRLEFMQIVGE